MAAPMAIQDQERTTRMPVYEYICQACKRRTSVFVRKIGQEVSPVCASCGGRDLSRAFSSFAYHKSMATIHEESGSPDTAGPDYYSDPRNIGRWTESKFEQYGMEMPSQVKEMIQSAREGELPAPVKDLQPGLTEV